LDNRVRDPEKVERHRKKYPGRYCPPPVPKVWDQDFPLSLFVDTPMHFLFVGIAKSVFFKIGVWSNKNVAKGPHF
jgi:hypothetical protein